MPFGKTEGETLLNKHLNSAKKYPDFHLPSKPPELAFFSKKIILPLDNDTKFMYNKIKTVSFLTNKLTN